MLQSRQFLFPSNFPLFPLKPYSPSLSGYRPSSPALPPSLSVSAHFPTGFGPWIAQIAESIPEEGPVELPLSMPSIFAIDDNPSAIQVATSVLLTGAIAVFLFRSLRRRARRAKELKFRSSGAKRTLKEEALDNLKAMSPLPAQENAPPSPLQALLGGLSAGLIALVLYKFTTTIEASLNRQNISDNFSVRQITITIRTIINGICYLATFVFGINSVGLLLYSSQLAINSVMGKFTNDRTQNKDKTQSTSINPPAGDSPELNTADQDQSSDNMQ